MERRLIVMRHAKSPHDNSTSDHQRPLSERGLKEAQEIAERLVQLGWSPRQVISSDALRTRQTWEAMAPFFEHTPEVLFAESFYLAGVDAIHDALSEIPDEISDVLLLGHNPGWQSAISYYCGEHHRLTTANAALLHATADSWQDVSGAGSFELVQLLRPRQI